MIILYCTSYLNEDPGSRNTFQKNWYRSELIRPCRACFALLVTFSDLFSHFRKKLPEILIMTNLPNHWNCHPHICSNQYILLLFLLLFRFKKEFLHVYFDSTVVSKVWKMRKQCKVNYFICFQNNFISNFPTSVHYQNRIKLFFLYLHIENKLPNMASHLWRFFSLRWKALA